MLYEIITNNKSIKNLESQLSKMNNIYEKTKNENNNIKKSRTNWNLIIIFIKYVFGIWRWKNKKYQENDNKNKLKSQYLVLLYSNQIVSFIAILRNVFSEKK